MKINFSPNASTVAMSFAMASLMLMSCDRRLESKSQDETEDKSLQSIEAKIVLVDHEYLFDMDQYSKAKSDSKVHLNLYPKYQQKVSALLKSVREPNALAELAIWAEHQDPWLDSQCHVCAITFFDCIERIRALHGAEAARALNKIELELKHNGHFDGHLAETILEAEDRANK